MLKTIATLAVAALGMIATSTAWAQDHPAAAEGPKMPPMPSMEGQQGDMGKPEGTAAAASKSASHGNSANHGVPAKTGHASARKKSPARHAPLRKGRSGKAAKRRH